MHKNGIAQKGGDALARGGIQKILVLLPLILVLVGGYGRVEGQSVPIPWPSRVPAGVPIGVCGDIHQTNLQACYDFLSSTDTEQTLTDRTGKGNDWTLASDATSQTRDPTWLDNNSDGEFDNLDATNATTDEYVDGQGITTYGTTSLFADAGESFTVQVVVKQDASLSEEGRFFNKGAGAGTFEIKFNTFDEVYVQLRGSGGSGDTRIATNVDDNWHMVTVIWDGASGTAYFDRGTAQALEVGTDADENLEVTLFCADTDGANTSACLAGNISFAVIYDAALTESQTYANYDTVKADYNTNRSISLP